MYEEATNPSLKTTALVGRVSEVARGKEGEDKHRRQQSLLAACLLFTTAHSGFAEQASWSAVSRECCQLLKTLVSEGLLSYAHSASLQYKQENIFHCHCKAGNAS